MEDVKFNITVNGNQAKATLDAVHNKVTGLSKSFVGFGSALKGSIAGYLSIQTFKSLASSAAAFADEIQNASDRLEITATNVQKLRIAGRHAGVTLGEVEGALTKMDEYLSDAVNKDSSKMSILSKLGFSEDEARKLDKYQALLKIISGAESSSNKVGLYRDIFGVKGGAKIMSMGPELQDDEFKNLLNETTIDEMDALADAFEDLKDTILTLIIPSMIRFAETTLGVVTGFMDATSKAKTLDQMAMADYNNKGYNINDNGELKNDSNFRHDLDLQAKLVWIDFQRSIGTYTQNESKAAMDRAIFQNIERKWGTESAMAALADFEKETQVVSFQEQLDSNKAKRFRAKQLKSELMGLNDRFDPESQPRKYWEIQRANISGYQTDNLSAMGNIIGKDASYRLERLSVEANKFLEKIAANSTELNNILKKNAGNIQLYAP